MKTIHDKVYEKAKVTVNVKVDAPAKPPVNVIKGNPIPGIQNIIAIASGKGGVGKSTVTANLGVTLAKMGFKVGVLDADIYGPSIPIMFDVENEHPLAINVDGTSKMRPIENYGVKILSIGFFTKPDQAVVWRGPMASKALNQMIFDAHWEEIDFLLIDLPPGTGDIHLSIMQSLPITGAVVVSTPQNVALADAKKSAMTLLFIGAGGLLVALLIIESSVRHVVARRNEPTAWLTVGIFLKLCLAASVSPVVACTMSWRHWCGRGCRRWRPYDPPPWSRRTSSVWPTRSGR